MSDWDRQLLNSDSLRALKPFNNLVATAALRMILDWHQAPERTLQELEAESGRLERQMFPYGVQKNPGAFEW